MERFMWATFAKSIPSAGFFPAAPCSRLLSFGLHADFASLQSATYLGGGGLSWHQSVVSHVEALERSITLQKNKAKCTEGEEGSRTSHCGVGGELTALQTKPDQLYSCHIGLPR